MFMKVLNKYVFTIFSPYIKFIYKYKAYDNRRVVNRNHKAMIKDQVVNLSSV